MDLAGTTAGDERAIRELVETWMAASRTGDLSKLLSLLADDVVFLTPGREPFGKDAFAAHTREHANVRMDGSAEIEELVVLGDSAWCRTHLVVTLTPPGGEARRHSGRTLTVLRKTSNGGWVIARDANLVAPEQKGRDATFDRAATWQKAPPMTATSLS